MNDGLIVALYAKTSEADMLALDEERRAAEADPQGADWVSLAERYEAQGRAAMAGKCWDRADYYGRVAVAVETEAVYA
jgi:hypothetical protein